MADIGDIVRVTVDRQTSAVTVAGFGLPLFLGLHKGFTSRYKEYGSVTEVAADFATTSNEYIAAQSFFGQETSINKIAIGRIDSTTATYTPVVTNSTNYVVTINTSTYTYPSDSSATAAEIVAGLIALINAGSEPVTASGTTTLVLTQDVAGVPFFAKASTNLTPVFATTETFADALTAVQLESNDWYGLTAYTRTKADQLAIAAWAQAADKLYGTASTDANIINQTLSADTTSAAVALRAAGYDRTFLIYSADAAKFPEAALFGSELARKPGAATWMFKALAGITRDSLTKTQITNANAKNVNVYIERAGLNMTQEGKTCEGTYIDIIRDIDSLKSNIEVAIFSRLYNLPKISYTDNDIAIIESELRAVVQTAINDKILADDPAPVIVVPKARDVSANDRANRVLPNITITARIAGAIHYCDVLLTVTV